MTSSRGECVVNGCYLMLLAVCLACGGGNSDPIVTTTYIDEHGNTLSDEQVQEALDNGATVRGNTSKIEPTPRERQAVAEHVVAPVSAATNETIETEVTVYVTNEGEKYHRANCRYLRASKTAMSLERARLAHDPCAKCNPPR